MFSTINPQLVTYVQSQVSEETWEEICKRAKLVAHAADFELEELPLLLATLTADLFEGEHHENKAYKWVLEHLADYGYGDYTNLVARIVHEHRASFKGMYTNKFCQFFAAINYGPWDIVKVIRNVYHYYFTTTILPPDGICLEMLEHFKKPLLRYKRPNQFHEALWPVERLESQLKALTISDIRAHVL